MAGYYEWRVSATINGKRIVTETKLFRNKGEAQAYAKATNKLRKGANARVVKIWTTD